MEDTQINTIRGSFFEYSDLKPNPKKQLSAFLFFSDLVLKQNVQRTNHTQIQYYAFYAWA